MPVVIWSLREGGVVSPAISHTAIAGKVASCRETTAVPGCLKAMPEEITLREDGDRWAIAGALNARTLPQAEAIERRVREAKPRALDMRELSTLDTPGALFLC